LIMDIKDIQENKRTEGFKSLFKKGEGKRNRYTLLTVVSYLSFLLVIMPTDLNEVINTLLVFLVGFVLILWKNPQRRDWKKDDVILKLLLLAAVLFSVYLGFCFYKQWIVSSKIRTLASKLHMPKELLIIAAAVVFSVGALYFVFLVFRKISERLTRSFDGRRLERNLICCLISAVATVFLSQMMLSVNLFSMGIIKCVVGSVIVFFAILTVYCLSGAIRISIVLVTIVFMIMSTVNVYVYNFRERLFEPIDLFSAGTAMNVADNYSLFPIPFGIIVGWIIWCALIAFMFWACAKEKGVFSCRKRLILSVYCVIGVCLAVLYTMNLKTYHWQKEGAEYNGYILDFISKIKEAYVVKPEGYSNEYIEELANRYALDEDAVKTDREYPHIIVIMDEAFSDLGVLGDFSTDKEAAPFISSLKENTVSGYALSSVFGGNTANSEFEFLTGNSMAWLSPNVVPYQQYIKDSSYSMVSYLKLYYNYRCIAMHPYLSDGWNRPETYANFGFDECMFIDDFPQQDIIRYFVSDREMFEEVVTTYEEQHETPLFIFGVSVQNHGGYSYKGKNFTQSVSLTGSDNAYPRVDQYLSLINETDKAAEYMISYFEAVDEDVVIVFFGDHQPKLDAAFYDDINENGYDSLDEQQKKFMVPFFIWANYDIDEAYIECTSLNYLSSYVYETAGVALPAYNRFLSEMEKKIPAINANGYYSKESQCYLPFKMASGEEKSLLERYKILQYNSLFGKKQINQKLFPVLE